MYCGVLFFTWIVRCFRGNDGSVHTTVSYEVAYTDEKPSDLEQQIYFSLLTNDNQLMFANNATRDLKQLKFSEFLVLAFSTKTLIHSDMPGHTIST